MYLIHEKLHSHRSKTFKQIQMLLRRLKNTVSRSDSRSSPPTPLSTGAAPSPPLYHRYYQDCNAVSTSGNLPITLHKYWEYRNSRSQRDLEQQQQQQQLATSSGGYDPSSLVYVKQEWIPPSDDFSKDWNWITRGARLRACVRCASLHRVCDRKFLKKWRFTVGCFGKREICRLFAWCTKGFIKKFAILGFSIRFSFVHTFTS